MGTDTLLGSCPALEERWQMNGRWEDGARVIIMSIMLYRSRIRNINELQPTSHHLSTNNFWSSQPVLCFVCWSGSNLSQNFFWRERNLGMFSIRGGLLHLNNSEYLQLPVLVIEVVVSSVDIVVTGIQSSVQGRSIY